MMGRKHGSLPRSRPCRWRTCGDCWVNVIPELTAAGYQAVVMDSRGHGRSSFDQRPISYELMASDVLALMDHLGIEQADLVGWSDGGIIGLELALTHPERLNKVVAYGANFDPTGVRLDIGQNAYFNAYIAEAAGEYQAMSPEPERWDEVPRQHLTHVGDRAELHRWSNCSRLRRPSSSSTAKRKRRSTSTRPS